MKNKAELVWNLDVPLVNNPYLFRASIKLSVLTWLVMVILFSLILGATGEWDTLPPLLLGATFAALGLWVLMIVVMLLFLVIACLCALPSMPAKYNVISPVDALNGQIAL